MPAAHLEGFGTLKVLPGKVRDTGRTRSPTAVSCSMQMIPGLIFWRRGSERGVKTFGMDNLADVTSPKVPEAAMERVRICQPFSGFHRTAVARSGFDLPRKPQSDECAGCNCCRSGGWRQPGKIFRPDWPRKPVPGRLQPLPAETASGLINDSYNANPDSVKAAIDLLASAPGRRYLVLGELAEMGADAASFTARSETTPIGRADKGIR